ncbi:hypothetical protein ARMGADRAFT_1093229 [Armillaria gallica]|uniref:Uncharacterized protein n=1 Tax=Armillaria gallica TaxID=47427 RepID=A0A2H3CLT4_ARMGA|nr:hypothetical protein ARMGADRAFT_1093229 [Armillaria gallica]
MGSQFERIDGRMKTTSYGTSSIQGRIVFFGSCTVGGRIFHIVIRVQRNKGFADSKVYALMTACLTLTWYSHYRCKCDVQRQSEMHQGSGLYAILRRIDRSRSRLVTAIFPASSLDDLDHLSSSNVVNRNINSEASWPPFWCLQSQFEMVHLCAKSIDAEHSSALTQHRVDDNHYFHGARGSAHDGKHQFIRNSLVLPIVIDAPTGFALTTVNVNLRPEEEIIVPLQRTYTGRTAVISASLADTPCAMFSAPRLLDRLNPILGTSYTMDNLSLPSLLEDCITKEYDFGTAYSHLCAVWYIEDWNTIWDKLCGCEAEDQEKQ